MKKLISLISKVISLPVTVWANVIDEVNEGKDGSHLWLKSETEGRRRLMMMRSGGDGAEDAN